jgi:hypothetical protein
MNKNLFLKLTLFFYLAALNVYTKNQDYIKETVEVSDFVGSEFYGYVDGVGDKTMFQLQSGERFMSVSDDGSIFLVDGTSAQQRIRKITKDGTVSTICSPTTIPSQIINPNRIPFVDSMIYSGNNSFLIWSQSKDALFSVDETFKSASILKSGLLTSFSGYFCRGICIDNFGNT